ncbi:MAG: helix-turn-helix domain-containing protein [Polyangia bacterium]
MEKESKGRVLSVNDVAQMCRVSNETIRRWIRKHGLKAYNTTGGLAIKILEEDLRDFAEELNVFVDWNYLKD